MKKILFSFCLLISGITLAQSYLPACISLPFNNCYGEWKYDDGNKYIGEWQNNQMNGQGTLTTRDGEKYVGQLKDGLRNGQGTNQWLSGDKYVGQYKDNKRSGQGTFIFSNGDKYVGQWLNDYQNGQGTYTFSNGNKYIGQYKDHKRNGLGTLYSPNGSIIQQGIWSDDKFVQSQSISPTIDPVVPIPPAITSNPQDIKRQKCIRLGLAPGSTDFQQCMN